MKKAARLEMNEKLCALSKEEHEQNSRKITKNLLAEKEWESATVVGVTISRYPEVETKQLIERAWQENKTVVVPKCQRENRQMTFRILQSFNELESVYFGLYEPKEDKTMAVSKNDIDLLLVPGLVYSKKGYRIGFGGGYYDRFLKDYQGATISLAFSCQIINDLPIEGHDIAVQKIITEKEVFSVEP